MKPGIFVLLLAVQAGSAAVYNVRSAPFNARGDGMSDDTAAVQAAVTAARSAGGGTVFFPAASGCYMVDHIDWYSNIALLGETRAVCIRKMATPPQTPYERRALINDAIAGMANVRIANITLDGNRANQPGVLADENGWYGILLLGSIHTAIEHVTIVDAATDGIMISGSGPQSSTGLDGVYINDVTVSNSRRNNMSILHGSNIFVRNSVFEKATGTAPEAGVDIEPFTASEQVSNVTFDRVVFQNNTQVGLLVYNAFAAQPKLNLRLNDCTITGNGKDGLSISGTYGVTGVDISGSISGNNVRQPWYARSSWYRGIILSGTTDARLANITVSETVGAALLLDGGDSAITVANATLSGGSGDLTIDAGATGIKVYSSTKLVNSRVVNHSRSTEFPAGTAPRITTTSLGPAVRNRPFSQTLAATGDGVITWHVARGALPTGLQLSSDGVLSGTPFARGTYVITLQADNSVASHQYTYDFTILRQAGSGGSE